MSSFFGKWYYSTFFRVTELLFFYLVLPLLTKWYISGMYIIIPLLTTAVLFFVFLWHDPTFDNKILYTLNKYPWKKAALRFLLLAAFAVGFTWYFYPDLFFQYPLKNTHNYLLTLGLYPFLSVIPQEVVYRSYFFHRYRDLFSQQWIFLFSNAFLFGFLHVIYNNWFAPIAAFTFSWIFIYNYLKTKSLVNVCIEHYFYGVALFTIGLGKFFK
ncbi:CPBP family intramembrane glutamic endopeptidase [Catalinimonas sp. 4WD22]|uniref:CPBP family intramembrane glutamic endopeptidase n=1 Tax=Catalinimonas locisalis TaxID=3133978 RepID=UPI0031015C44